MKKVSNQNHAIDVSFEAEAIQMYRKVLSGWAADLLSGRCSCLWKQEEPVVDFRRHHWHRLYNCSILDD